MDTSNPNFVYTNMILIYTHVCDNNVYLLYC